LPFEFKKAEAIEIGDKIGIAERTVAKYLSKLQKTCNLEQPKYGHYRKTIIGEMQTEIQDEIQDDAQEDFQENLREIQFQEKLQELFYELNPMMEY